MVELLLIIFYPLIISILIIILFIKVFKNSHLPKSHKIENRFGHFLFITSILFYTLLLLWLLAGIKVVGQYSFSAIIFFTGSTTALYYPIANKSLMSIKLRHFEFTLSIIPWLSIVFLTNPLYSWIMKPYGINEAFGLVKEIVFENEYFRVEKYSRLHSAGDQYHHHIIRKHSIYEMTKYVSDYPSEIQNRYIKKLISKSAEFEKEKTEEN